MTWELAPDGPPIARRRGRYDDMYRWLDEHPGEWIVIPDAPGTLPRRLRQRGYEATGRYTNDNTNHCDVYVRNPVQ